MFIRVKERAQSNKFLVEDGLVNYNGEMLEPEVAFQRFIDETPLLTVIAGDVSRRHIEPYKGKSYRWELLKDLRL
jgi:hypothetical protein